MVLIAIYRPISPAALKRSEIAVGCSALLGFVIMSLSYDYISSGVIFFQIPVGLRGLAQRVRSVDDRCDLVGFNELFQNNQVLMVRRRHERASLLAPHRGMISL